MGEFLCLGRLPLLGFNRHHQDYYTFFWFGKINYLLTQDVSHHQEYAIFSREYRPEPSFPTGILRMGVDATDALSNWRLRFFDNLLSWLQVDHFLRREREWENTEKLFCFQYES